MCDLIISFFIASSPNPILADISLSASTVTKYDLWKGHFLNADGSLGSFSTLQTSEARVGFHVFAALH